MSLGSKVSGNGIKDGEEPLCLFRRFEALRSPLALPGWLLGVLGPVVQIAALAMSDIGGARAVWRRRSSEACR